MSSSLLGRRPTHRDIAQRAGTSQATVSLVLNNRQSAVGISNETRLAVLAAARELGYTADLGARRLRDRNGAAAIPEMTLAILRPAGVPLGLSVRLLDVATSDLATHSPTSQLVLEQYTPGHVVEHPGLVAVSRFHGAIVTSMPPEDSAALAETALPLPVVAFQRTVAGHAYVDVDNFQGGVAAAERLIARGCRRIAAVGWSSIGSLAADERLRGYREALGRAGLTERVVWAASLSEAGGAAATTQLLREASETARPDGIFALSDVLATGVRAALYEAGLSVPEDVALVGYDDLPIAQFMTPPLTTVRLPYEELGRAAVAWLVDAVRGRAEAPLQRVYAPTLVIRASA
jgi:DNA-binding LacI/PurR family transcriptional regulator